MRLISLRLVITALTTLFAAAATAPARAADPCTFLTTAQVTAAMGTPVNDGTPGPKNCMWHATKRDGNVYITLRDSASFAAFKSAGSIRRPPGARSRLRRRCLFPRRKRLLCALRPQGPAGPPHHGPTHRQHRRPEPGNRKIPRRTGYQPPLKIETIKTSAKSPVLAKGLQSLIALTLAPEKRRTTNDQRSSGTWF